MKTILIFGYKSLLLLYKTTHLQFLLFSSYTSTSTSIFLAIKTWAKDWLQAKLIIYTNSTIVFYRLIYHTLQGEASLFLQEIFLFVAEYNSKIMPQYIPSQQNGLADTLSCFGEDMVANLYSYWQAPWSLILLLQSS